MEKLGIQPILIIAQIVNFVILLLLLKKFLFKPILKVLDERKKKAEETEELNNEAGKKFLEATESEKNTISEAKKQADKIITQSK
ncbi:MAG: ATP synthase subunit b, partial [candidate division CPR3 bacterium GW2011_GWE2_35_7]